MGNMSSGLSELLLMQTTLEIMKLCLQSTETALVAPFGFFHSYTIFSWLVFAIVCMTEGAGQKKKGFLALGITVNSCTA